MPICSQGVISSARRSAKAEVRGANPRESAKFKSEIRIQHSPRRFRISNFGFRICMASVPQQLQDEFRKLVFVGASPTGGSISMNEFANQ